MKKIIAAIDGLKFSESTVRYAINLARQSNAHLVGVFLEDFTYHSYKVYDLMTDDAVTGNKREMLDEKDKITRDKSVALFETACQEASLNYSLHHDRSIAIQELLHESIYADLLVIDRSETLSHYDEGEVPTPFIRNLLEEVKCPVLVVPKTFRPIDKLVLLYDGQPSSVYAIRTFSYVFPSLKYLSTEVISVTSSQTNHLPDNRLMKEFMKRHFPKAEYTVLTGEPETEISKHLDPQSKNMLIVLGAYQRGMVSRWFRPSMADVLMKELKVPLFIAHSS